MRVILIFTLLLTFHFLHGQAGDDVVKKFITLFKAQMAKLNVGKIEDHFEAGYFKALTGSDYFDGGMEVSIVGAFQNCKGKNEEMQKKEINRFFEQHKALNIQRKAIEAKMGDFDFIKPYLKIRIYAEELWPQYEKYGIVSAPLKGMIEVVVLNLPTGVGNLEKTHLNTWHKSAPEIYQLAKENTLKSLDQNFEKSDAAKTGEQFYVLASDTNLFITSSLLDLQQAGMPHGKHGTLVAAPNNGAVVALPLDDSLKINQFCHTFKGLANYMYESPDTKPISSNIFWHNGNRLQLIDKDPNSKRLIYPAALRQLVGQ